MPSPSLPAEILSHVFSFCHPSSFLASVPLVSRQWRQLALDFLGPDGVLIDVHIVLTAMDVHETWHAWHRPSAYDRSSILHDKFHIVPESDTTRATRLATVAGSVVAHPPHQFLPSDVPRVISAVLAPLVGYPVRPRVQSVDISQCYYTIPIRTALRVMREHLTLTVYQIRTLSLFYEAAAFDQHVQDSSADAAVRLEGFETIHGVYVTPYHNISTLRVELATLLTVFPNLTRLGMFRPLDDAWVFLSHRADELPTYPRGDVTLALQLDASSLTSFTHFRIDDQLVGFNHCLKTLFPHGIPCVELHVYRDGRSPRGEQMELDVWCRVAASIPAASVEVYTDGVRFGEGQKAAWSQRVVEAIRDVARESGKKSVKADFVYTRG